MKLTAKIVSVFFLAMVVLTAVHGHLTVRRETQRLRREMMEDAHALARSMEERISVTWRERGQQGVMELIRNENHRHQHLHIRWVDLDGAGQGGSAALAPIERLRSVRELVSVVGHDVQHVYYPVDLGNRRMGCLEFAEPLEEIDRYVLATTWQLLGGVAAMALCGLVVSLLGIRWVGWPLEQLIAKSKRIGEGDLSGPLEVRGRDELSELARAMNEMCDRLAESQAKIRAESDARVEAVEQLRHADRLQTVGRLAAGVAHELGTPLNVVAGQADLIASGRLSDEQMSESARAIKAEADRMTAIIRQLLDFARRRLPEPEIVDLGEVAGSTVELLRTLAEKRGVRLALERSSAALTAMADAGQMQQVVTNLVVNAIQATPEGGSVTVQLGSDHARRPESPGTLAQPCVWIRVRDDGVGIEPDEMEHLFEPFFTTKDVGQGTGLGLSVSYGIVQDHEGWIEVASEPGEGSCFTVYLPQRSQPCPQES